MFRSAWLLLTLVVGEGLAYIFRIKPSEEKVVLPEEVFPILPQYNYCELMHFRGTGKIYLTVRPKGKLRKSIVYVFETDDMSRIKQLVQADGFLPSRDDWGLLETTCFIDHESDNYFFSR
ncbi:MAG: hypothetical protein JXJ20_11775 [Anaerolineae bacterium]|jgi:hypothetical protein|nr:hypothetical protein [Anaerolineae bacterium]